MFVVLQSVGLARASGTSPYPASTILGSIKWNEAHQHRIGSHPSPAGSDIWNTTWGSDGNLYSAWGDGKGISGTEEAQIGLAKLEGTPTESTSITAEDRYFGMPKVEECVENPTKLDGKPHGIVALPGEVMYMFHWAQDRAKCKSEKDPHPTYLAKSTDNGKTWTDKVGGQVWPGASGFSPNTVLQYGKAEAGALAPESGTVGPYIYIYGLNTNDVAHSGKVYLARVPASPVTDIESPSEHWQFYEGLDEKGNAKWGSEKNAAVVLQDSNGGNGVSVSFDKAIGRYVVYDTHFDVCGGVQCEPERAVSLFDGPTPWGPWTTFDYENQFANGTECGTSCLGNTESVSLELPPKWMNATGLKTWAAFSATEAFDSLNLIEGTISLASSGSSVDSIEVQPVGTATAGTPAVTGHLSVTGTTPESKAFIDRPYRLTTIPTAYRGLEQIRLANADKSASAASKYLTFTVTKKENVCVGWDNRGAAPEWLTKSWVKQGSESNLVSEETGFATVTFNVYKREFEAGSTVTLNGAQTENDQYVVFVGC
ncbi:MAG: DUF4185 domain-containing protein [Actinobacteria bacterium]|nr:DUF4185 domain-containing protein [Actinomycetota bacterium]